MLTHGKLAFHLTVEMKYSKLYSKNTRCKDKLGVIIGNQLMHSDCSNPSE